MSKELEKTLGLEKKERQSAKQILHDLQPYLDGEWILVGGLPLRYYMSLAGKKWRFPFNDLDLISKKESILSPNATESFHVLHHHSNPTEFYFQMWHKDFPGITVDIFADKKIDEENKDAEILEMTVRIPIPEEMYLHTISNILLLLNHPRGLPPKHIERLLFLEHIVDPNKTAKLWEKRHETANQNGSIYNYSSLKALKAELELALEEKKENIKEWIKSDPLVKCSECVVGADFPLYRNRQNQ